MSDNELHIDESRHQRVLSLRERCTHALLCLLLGFLLINIIAFWIFPGVGLGGFYLFSSVHSTVGVIGELTSVFTYAFLAICTVMGWFRGKYFTDRLKGFIEWWKFW